MKEQHVGIMGGTFDPIHHGHLILAQTAMEQFQLDQILFMPTRTPPHKSADVTDPRHRIAMTELAIKSHPGFALSTFEMEREGYTFTCETLKLLKEKQPHVHFYFLMGEDSLADFQKWKDPQTIADLCTILVANRSEEPDAQLKTLLAQVSGQYHGDFRLLQIPALEISSHALREKVRKGQSVRYYTPDPVVDYLEANGLYR